MTPGPVLRSCGAMKQACRWRSSSWRASIGAVASGVGAARRLIARFPGPWRITQRESNRPAIAFWHRVLDGFAAYDEVTTATDAVRREQRFTFPRSTFPTG